MDSAPDECDLPPTAEMEPAGLHLWLGGRLKARDVQRDFSSAPLQKIFLPRAFGGVCASAGARSLKPAVDSSWTPVRAGKLPAAGPRPSKNMARWLLGCGGQKYRGFRREFGTFALAGTASVTNYGANSKSITEGLL